MKKRLKQVLLRPIFWLREIFVYSFITIAMVLIIYYLDISNVNIFVIIFVSLLTFGILFYIYGVFNLNFINPLCNEKVEGHRVSYNTDIESGPGNGVVGFLESYVVLIEYKYKSKTYKRLIKTLGESVTIEEIRICKFFPRLVYVKFSNN